MRIQVFNPLGGSVAGTLVAPCRLVGCDAAKPVEADGSVEFELNSGFGTYVEVTGPGVVPTRTHWQHPLYGDRTSRSIPVLTVTEFDSMYGQIFQPAPSPGVGTVFVSMGDCVGTMDFRNQATLDVSFQLEPAATNPIYADGANVPNEQLASAERAWFFNVPPGLVTVTGLTPGQKATSVAIKVDAGWMTVVWLNMPYAAQ